MVDKIQGPSPLRSKTKTFVSSSELFAFGNLVRKPNSWMLLLVSDLRIVADVHFRREQIKSSHTTFDTFHSNNHLVLDSYGSPQSAKITLLEFTFVSYCMFRVATASACASSFYHKYESSTKKTKIAVM